MRLTVGGRYSKNDLYVIFNVPPERQKGPWNTGYLRYNNSFFIFANIDVPGRTGHDYQNKWKNGQLTWYGKTGSHIAQPIIRNMLSSELPVLIFTRHSDREAFIFRGYGKENGVDDTVVPVKITWQVSESVRLVTNEALDIELSKEIRQAKNDTIKRQITSLRRLRGGQLDFKDNLSMISEGKCSITGCEIPQILQACHLIPHAETGNNHTGNGLLLRSDIHDLFDSFLIGINPNTGEIHVKEVLNGTEYQKYRGRVIRRNLVTLHPDALHKRWALYLNKDTKE